MKFKVEVNQKLIEEYFDNIDYLKECIFKAKDNDLIEGYQALLCEYEMKLDNIIIERG